MLDQENRGFKPVKPIAFLRGDASVLRHRFLLLFFLVLVFLWVGVFLEIARNRQEVLHEGERTVQLQAQIYAENLRSTIKRLDELLYDFRSGWRGDWKRFSDLVRARQESIHDIAFQVAVIDADGLLAYSNLAPATNRIDLRDREHFRAHLATDEDRLFISKPVKGRVSGKWSIQFTRAIRVAGKFAGVLVVSISPEVFSSLHERFNLSDDGATSVLSDSGHVLARRPGMDRFLGQQLAVSWPSSSADAPETGFFHYHAQLDGIERVFGYQKLPDYALSCFVSESLDSVLEPHYRYTAKLRTYALLITLVLSGFALILLRLLRGRERVGAMLLASREKQRLLSQAIEQSNAAVMMVDCAGIITFVNDAFVRSSGFSREEVIGASPRILKSGSHSQEIYDEIWQNILSGHSWQGELQNRRKNGELYWESISISPVIDEGGKVVHFIAVKEDIGARKRQEVELLLAKEEAEAANQAKSQFLATMSHEIRTPMNGILGMAQMLLEPGLRESERNDYARTILNSGKTLQTLLNDILDLSRVEAGKLELTPTRFDPSLMVAETAALFGESVRQKGLQLDWTWCGGAGAVYRADGIRLRQMLTNLLSNAIKFTDKGRIVINAAEISRRDGQAFIEFAVSDTGVGVPAAKQSLLFQPFSQVDASDTRRYAGTGLGLSIVRRFAELMSGEVGMSSQPGLGSRFWFRVWVDCAEADGGELVTEGEGRSMEPGSATAIKKILVAEDNRTNQAVIRAMLGRLGYEVSCCGNGAEVVDAVVAGMRPDLILMDCHMPEMDGLEATRRIRQHEVVHGGGRIRIIALTAGAFEEDRQRCLDAGMDDFLTKPVERDRLLVAINALPA